MLLETILNNLPEYAKDTKLNFSGIMNNHGLLTTPQFYGLVLASAIASRNKDLIVAIEDEVSNHIDEKVIVASKAAASIMAMNNIYYRFTDLIDNQEYRKMPPGLRMNVMRDTSVGKVDFELWSLAVSIINGCSLCINSHEKQLITHGVSKEVIQFIAKAAAIIHALAVTHESI